MEQLQSEQEGASAVADGNLPMARQQQQQHADTGTAPNRGGTARSDCVADRMAVLRTRETCAANGSAALLTTQPESEAQRHTGTAEVATEDGAGEWQARLMEAMMHEQRQVSEPAVPGVAVDITDEGWLPT